VESSISSRLAGLQGRLTRPFWGGAGLWAVLCGALASGGLRPDGEALWTLLLVLLLTELGWGSLWDLLTGSRWPLAAAGSERHRVAVPRPGARRWMPYTLPGSPAGRLFDGLGQLATWWRERFWPAAGGALLGSAAAVALVLALSLILPGTLRLLNAALVGLVGLGLWQRRRGRLPLLAGAVVQVGLGWLAGHLAFAPMSGASLLLALAFAAAFAVAVWGGLRLKLGLRGGAWLLDGGQVVVVAILALLRQPLAAFAAGMLLLGQAAMQPGLDDEQDRAQAFRRTWPWLMAAMLVAALAMP